MANEDFRALSDNELEQVAGGGKGNGAPHIDESNCIGCGICASECPTDAISDSSGCYRISASRCVGCGVCVKECPGGVIEW